MKFLLRGDFISPSGSGLPPHIKEWWYRPPRMDVKQKARRMNFHVQLSLQWTRARSPALAKRERITKN